MSSSPSSNELHEDLLVGYVLGTLDQAEMQQVSALLQAQPELRHRLTELRSVANVLPYGLPEATPSADLRQRVLDRATSRTQAPAPTRAQRRGTIATWVAGLSMTLALLLLALVIAFQLRLSTQQQLVAEQQQLISVLNAPDVQVSAGQGNGGRATFVHSATGDALVAQLPQLQRGRTYQLWLIKDQNTPPSGVGTFAVDSSGHGTLVLTGVQQTIASASVFAITDEPLGGSPAPTTDVLVSGTFTPS